MNVKVVPAFGVLLLVAPPLASATDLFFEDFESPATTVSTWYTYSDGNAQLASVTTEIAAGVGVGGSAGLRQTAVTNNTGSFYGMGIVLGDGTTIPLSNTETDPNNIVLSFDVITSRDNVNFDLQLFSAGGGSTATKNIAVTTANVPLSLSFTMAELGGNFNLLTTGLSINLGETIATGRGWGLADGGTRTFVVDNVRLRAVPEPAGAALLGLGALALLRRR